MLSWLNVEIVLATSSTLKNKSGRDEILLGLKDGKTKIAIDTHSLDRRKNKI
jgi:RecG-like helicase